MRIGFKEQNFNKILVIRTDRLGDVILSLPVLTALKESFPGVRVSMLLRPYTAELVENYPDVDDIITLTDSENSGRLNLIKPLVLKLKQREFDAALILHPTLPLALACALAKIPVRVGTGYRAYSFLFNQKVFHHRKRAGKHELDYNLDLAEKIGARLKQVQFKIQIPENLHRETQVFYQKLKKENNQKVVILHPGSGGSALDWPLSNFAKLNDALQEKLGVKTIVTGGSNEISLVEKFISLTRSKPMKWIGGRGLKSLAALIQSADLFVANSTGPLHLAVAVGTPVVGFYCPIIPCSPQRWGPYGQSDSVLMPPVKACEKCLTMECKHFHCMELISVESAFELSRKKLSLQGKTEDNW